MDRPDEVMIQTPIGEMRAYRMAPVALPDRWHVEFGERLKVELAPGWYRDPYYHVEFSGGNATHELQLAKSLVALVLLSLKNIHPDMPEGFLRAIDHYSEVLQIGLLNAVRPLTPDVVFE